MTETRMPPSVCASCGDVMDCATSAYQRGRPSPGDASMCMRCGHLSIFDDGLRLRNPTAEEAAQLAADPRIQIALRERRKVMNKRRH